MAGQRGICKALLPGSNFILAYHIHTLQELLLIPETIPSITTSSLQSTQTIIKDV
jgi:hypothetical protein